MQHCKLPPKSCIQHFSFIRFGLSVPQSDGSSYLIHDKEKWIAVRKKLEAVNLEDFVFVHNAMVSSEILHVVDIIESNELQVTKMGAEQTLSLIHI